MNNMVKSASSFDIIVITSPDEESALAVREFIVSSCGSFPSDYLNNNDDNVCVMHSNCGTVFISTCDPLGVRMGR